MSEPDYPEMMTVKETAAFLRMHAQSIYARIRRGTLPALRVGHEWRVPKSLLIDLARQRLRPELREEKDQ
jgi:excisionase family DNA binding protein